MVFPDDEREANPASFKFLEMAHKWKRMQATGGGGRLSAPLAPARTITEPEPEESSAFREQNQSEEKVSDEDENMASSDGAN